MKRPKKPIPVLTDPVAVIVPSRGAWHQALTDDHGEFDVAQIGVAVAIFGITGLAYWARYLGQQINFMELGTGIAAVIGALGVYKWGDKRPTPPQTTTTATVQQVITP